MSASPVTVATAEARPAPGGLSWAPAFSGRRAAVLMFLALALNSLFAVFGSLLWGNFPFGYWPAYMISVLVTAYFGWWGVLLAVLSPVASTFLGMADSQFYLYLPVSFVQTALAMLAFRRLRIAPSLKGTSDRIKYVLFAVIVPSAVGATFAWLLRSRYPDVHDPPLDRYVYNWTAENLLPALIPGIWLHRIVGETYQPFTWEMGKRPRSWARKAIDHCMPWLLSLACIGAMLVLVVIRMVRYQPSYRPGLTAPGFWRHVSEDVVSQIPGFPLTILALTVSFLFSLGYSIRYAKQAWVLAEAVRRHFPDQKISDLLLSGIAAPTERRTVAMAMFQVGKLGEATALLSPEQLIRWLNRFFSLVADSCSRLGASIDTLVGDSLTVVFDPQNAESRPARAVQAVIEVFEALDAANRALVQEGLPALAVTAAVEYGAVVAGEIGVPTRKQYAFVGDAVMACRLLARQAHDLPDGFCRALISRRCLKEAGLLPLADDSDSFVPLSVTLGENEPPQTVYGLSKSELSSCRKKIAQLDGGAR